MLDRIAFFPAFFCGLTLLASPAAAPAAPRENGHLILAQSAFPPCLDVAQSARAQNATRQALDNLVEQDKRTGAIVPWLATGWEYRDGGRELVLSLRHDVTFSNGQAFDAEAVKENFDTLARLSKEGLALQARGYLAGYEGSTVVDRYMVVLRFSYPKAGFLQALSEKTLSPLASETLRKTPQERCAGALIGTGPFVISRVVQNERIELVRRPDYAWASPNANHLGPAYLEKVTFLTVPEASVRIGSLLSGQVDAIEDVPTDAFPRLKAARIAIIARTAGGVGMTLFPNIAHPILADSRVRRALVIGIDRDEVLTGLYTSYDHVATSVLSSTVPGYVDLSDKLAYRPEMARRLLEEAGWKLGADGIRVRDGQRLSIELIWSYAGFTPDLQLIREQLAKIGVELRLGLRTDAELGGFIRNGQYDLRLSDLTRPDPDVLLPVFYSPDSAYIKWPQEDLDALLAEQSRTLDSTQRQVLVRRIQEKILDEGYAIPLRESSTILAVWPRVRGIWLSAPRWPILADASFAD